MECLHWVPPRPHPPRNDPSLLPMCPFPINPLLNAPSPSLVQVGALEAIRVKILVKGEPGRLDVLRVGRGGG